MVSGDTPKVSVIIPVYNAELHLQECLDSIADQSMQDYEIICIDDGSVDGSAEILAHAQKNNSKIHVITQSNAGAAVARNVGIDRATGKYLIFIDADDFISPDLFVKCYEKAELHCADIVAFEHYNYFNEYTEPDVSEFGLRKYVIGNTDVFSWKDFSEGILDAIAPSPWNKFFRREFILSHGLRYQNLPAFNDVFFCSVVLVLAEKICCIREPLIYYRVGNRSQSITAKKIKEFDSLVAAVNAVIEVSQNLPYYKDIRPSLNNFVVNFYVYYLRDIIEPRVAERSLSARIRQCILNGYTKLARSPLGTLGRICIFVPLGLLRHCFLSVIYFFKTPEQKLYAKTFDRIHTILQGDFFERVNPQDLSISELPEYYAMLKQYDHDSVTMRNIGRMAASVPSYAWNALQGARRRAPVPGIFRVNSAHSDVVGAPSQGRERRTEPDGFQEFFLFYSSPMRPRSVLLVEPNHCHGEVLPGYAQYLLDLGYAVDVLVTTNQAEKDPLVRMPKSALRVFALSQERLGQALQSDKVQQYEFVFFTSYTMYKWLGDNHYPSVREHFPHIGNAKSGMLAVSHHTDKTPGDLLKSGRVVTLDDFNAYFDTYAYVVNPQTFGSVQYTPKNFGKTHFIMVGAIEAHRRNCSLLIDAVDFLISQGFDAFMITLVGRGSLDGIPLRIQQYLNFLGPVDYPTMYSKMEEADFFLPLLDPENPEHDRYLTTVTSGSFQLIHGFRKPCLIAEKFASRPGFTSENSIIYQSNDDLGAAMAQAIALSRDDYQRMQESLGRKAEQACRQSLEQLRTALETLKRNDKVDTPYKPIAMKEHVPARTVDDCVLTHESLLAKLHERCDPDSYAFHDAKYHIERYMRTVHVIREHAMIAGNVLEAGGQSFFTDILKQCFSDFTLWHSNADLRFAQPFSGAYFDSIIATEVFEHVNDVSIEHEITFSGVVNMLREFHRLLKDGGKLFLSTPNVCGASAITRCLEGKHPFMYGPHFREYTPDEIQQLIQDAGFKVMHMSTEFVWNKRNSDVAALLEKNGRPIENSGDDIFIVACK